MQLQALLACGNWADLTGVSIVPILLALARGSVHLLAVDVWSHRGMGRACGGR